MVPGGLKPLEERLVSGPGGEIKPARLMHVGFSPPALGEEDGWILAPLLCEQPPRAGRAALPAGSQARG